MHTQVFKIILKVDEWYEDRYIVVYDISEP